MLITKQLGTGGPKPSTNWRFTVSLPWIPTVHDGVQTFQVVFATATASFLTADVYHFFPLSVHFIDNCGAALPPSSFPSI